jgi:hypothetical protein
MISEEERNSFAIKFAEWVLSLRPHDRCSVWSKDGSSRGLYTQDTEQLLDRFLEINALTGDK